ncbi:lytic transglycosylase domain-containing protein [Desulfobacula toluolica]|uniref:Predicted lytic transglycosylase n=1 Tax=Desulfobacula toluolica (strain DSM 7467 / Tol2) TaxID=651182 RepID=K0NLR8_DESTT|nr:lytic transglycosylase domain-containing protein [Desulfobacula toluolica]CCK79597.1 predicted lytic transglycosylase [Desulfobacula toluolica Tol2]
MQYKYLCNAIFISIVCFLSPLICLGTEQVKYQNLQQNVPSLMESIRFKNDIHYCDIKIPLDHQEIKESLEKELLLALWDRPQVILWIKRSARYFPHVEHILKQHGLPLDFKYVPVIESALRPHAGSSKGAVGYWQFLKSTGRRYGLRIDSKVDERRNIFKSTHAACKYIKALNLQFGSYLLALSAYNMGEYGLEGEIELQKNNNYFSLYLPLETQRYVFKLISAKLILENQERYGFYLKKSDLYPVFTFDKVNFKSDFKMPIALIARAAAISFKAVKDYNPELRGHFLGKGDIQILIPKGKAKGFKERFTTNYKNWEKTYKTKFHIVKQGESLIGIAKAYKISLFSLLRLNDLSANVMIHPGDRLTIE